MRLEGNLGNAARVDYYNPTQSLVWVYIKRGSIRYPDTFPLPLSLHHPLRHHHYARLSRLPRSCRFLRFRLIRGRFAFVRSHLSDRRAAGCHLQLDRSSLLVQGSNCEPASILTSGSLTNFNDLLCSSSVAAPHVFGRRVALQTTPRLLKLLMISALPRYVSKSFSSHT